MEMKQEKKPMVDGGFGVSTKGCSGGVEAGIEKSNYPPPIHTSGTKIKNENHLFTLYKFISSTYHLLQPLPCSPSTLTLKSTPSSFCEALLSFDENPSFEIKRGNVQGLNPLMFIFALAGNSTYVASLISFVLMTSGDGMMMNKRCSRCRSKSSNNSSIRTQQEHGSFFLISYYLLVQSVDQLCFIVPVLIQHVIFVNSIVWIE
ncbi:uncharacterized protein [Rutidosis leptorrhynchoides]|uniref:uncharacterized protein n=1 Tax=Rutidosis leptorrhynchoides TaxID=125765 RepID=UPI003A99A608